LLYEWLGEPVIVTYTYASFSKGSDSFSLARGVPELRRAVFILREVSSLGIVLRRLHRPEEGKSLRLGASIFMPWSTLHRIQGVSKDEEEPDELWSWQDT